MAVHEYSSECHLCLVDAVISQTPHAIVVVLVICWFRPTNHVAFHSLFRIHIFHILNSADYVYPMIMQHWMYVTLAYVCSRQIGKTCFINRNNAFNPTWPYIQSDWPGLKTILNAFMKIHPRKMQPIPTNHHFCHRYEAFLSGHFAVLRLLRVYPAINAALVLGKLFQG